MSCPTPAKVGYESRRKALGAMGRANQLYGNEGRFRSVYKCTCKRWHLTSQENSHRRTPKKGIEIDPAALRAFMDRNGLTQKRLEVLAGLPERRIKDALYRGRMNANDLAALQEAMAGLVRERRRRMERAGVK